MNAQRQFIFVSVIIVVIVIGSLVLFVDRKTEIFEKRPTMRAQLFFFSSLVDETRRKRCSESFNILVTIFT